MQVAIVLYEGLTALDALGPYELLRLAPDTQVRFVGHEPGPVIADSGVLAIGVTHSFAETPAPDIVLVPGSEGATATAMADKELTGWLAAVHEQTQWTTSVCSGALILAAAGLLAGKSATTHWIAQPALKALGVSSRPNDRIVHDGKVITAAGVSAGLDLALWLINEVHGRQAAEIVQLSIEYDPQPPLDSGHPSKASDDVLKAARNGLLKRGASPREAISIGKVAWQRAITTIRGTHARR